MWDMNDVVKIFYKGKYTYNIVFDNGVSGDVDISKYIKKERVFQKGNN